MNARVQQPRRIDRRLTMQALYQIDVTGVTEPAELAEALDEEHDTADGRRAAAELAAVIWAGRQAYDELATKLAPDWPTHRQPPVDRAIIRLACHEMATGRTDPRIAINEAVNLAKQFAAEQSPAFINGVLDKAARRLKPADGAKPTTGDAWLDDAITPNDE